MEQANRNPSRFFGSKDKRSVVLPTDDIFGPRGTVVTPAGIVELTRLSALLKVQGKRRVRIELHTDARGDLDAEQELTVQQANAVRSWLERTGGVDVAKLDIVGLGSRRPLAALGEHSPVPDTDSRMELHVLEVH